MSVSSDFTNPFVPYTFVSYFNFVVDLVILSFQCVLIACLGIYMVFQLSVHLYAINMSFPIPRLLTIAQYPSLQYVLFTPIHLFVVYHGSQLFGNFSLCAIAFDVLSHVVDNGTYACAGLFRFLVFFLFFHMQ